MLSPVDSGRSNIREDRHPSDAAAPHVINRQFRPSGSRKPVTFVGIDQTDDSPTM